MKYVCEPNIIRSTMAGSKLKKKKKKKRQKILF